jgi:ribosome maturation protein SDO1
MISLDDAVIARYQKANLTFEILVDPVKARKLREGENIGIEDVVAARDVFSDSKKGERASESDINKTFGTNDFGSVAKIIIQKGEIQLTTEQRKKMQEDRKKQIITLIARSAVDPRTHLPHPPQRIEKALDEARIHVDPFKSVESQMGEVLKSIRKILPIKLETVRIAIKVSAQYGGPVCGYMHQHKMLKEEWGSDGSYFALIELSAGLQGDFLNHINKMTHGDVESKVTERI